MSALSPQFRMADRLTGGTLETIIREGREHGLSFDSIAARLWAEHQVEATGNTIRSWAVKLGVEPQPDEAAS